MEKKRWGEERKRKQRQKQSKAKRKEASRGSCKHWVSHFGMSSTVSMHLTFKLSDNLSFLT